MRDYRQALWFTRHDEYDYFQQSAPGANTKFSTIQAAKRTKASHSPKLTPTDTDSRYLAVPPKERTKQYSEGNECSPFCLEAKSVFFLVPHAVHWKITWASLIILTITSARVIILTNLLGWCQNLWKLSNARDDTCLMPGQVTTVQGEIRKEMVPNHKSNTKKISNHSYFLPVTPATTSLRAGWGTCLAVSNESKMGLTTAGRKRPEINYREQNSWGHLKISDWRIKNCSNKQNHNPCKQGRKNYELSNKLTVVSA